MAKFAMHIAAGAALLWTATAGPAFATADPTSNRKANAGVDAPATTPLSAKARKMVWCVADKADPEAKKVCKTREKWIAEGKDPFGKY